MAADYRAAPWVVGGYLIDNHAPRCTPWPGRHTDGNAAPRSPPPPFTRHGDVEDIFALAALLVHDPEQFVRTAVGGWVREAGKHEREQLRVFLDTYAATMPRITMRFAVEHLDPDERRHYRDRRPDT